MAKKISAPKAAQKKKSPPLYDEDDQLAEAFSDNAEEEESGSKSEKSRDGDAGSVYKVIEVVGSSPKSWEHAAQLVVERASKTLEDLRVAEVVAQDVKIEDGGITAYRTKLRLSFKFNS